MTAPYFQDGTVTLYHGDALEVLRSIPDASVDAVVTDPPYGIRFMGSPWDGADIVAQTSRWRETSPMPSGVGGPNGGHRSAAAEAGRYDRDAAANRAFQEWSREWATECLRALKPGGHLVTFGSPRTFHRLTAGVEDAGFEIRDVLSWLYGSGFPKSLNVAKAVDAHVSVGGSSSRQLREVEQAGEGEAYTLRGKNNGIVGEDRVYDRKEYTPSEAAAQWDGWGTALKPAWEPIVLARKSFAGTVAANVLEHGTGALNIDACRVAYASAADRAAAIPGGKATSRVGALAGRAQSDPTTTGSGRSEFVARQDDRGRFPANVVLDQEAATVLDEQSGTSVSRQGKPRGASPGPGWGMTRTGAEYDDEGGASRFFYSAKASPQERPVVDGVAHPTVKPLALMEWLIELVTRPGGVVLEPFAGSGTTLEAAQYTGRSAIGVEREASYLPLIDARLSRKDPRLVAKTRPAAPPIEGQAAFDLFGAGEAS